MRRKQEENEEQIEEVESTEEESSETKSVKKAQSLSDLPGIGPATVEKLQTVGYRDLMAVAVATPGEIIDATGMTQAAAKKVIATARASLDMGFESGIELLEKRSKVSQNVSVSMAQAKHS